MRTVRIWLLLLLATLLPMRGAVAAVMLCPLAESGSQVEWRLHEHSLGHEAMDSPSAAEHASAHAAHATHVTGEQRHHESASEHDECNLCSAFCSVTPMVSSLPAVVAAIDAATAAFPELGAPAVSFLSGGQDRPPRRI